MLGLSASGCLKRVRRLEEGGAIKGYVALAEETMFASWSLLWVNVKLRRRAHKRRDEFEAALRAAPERGAARRLIIRVIPEATYKRRVRLNLEESERTERLARVIATAEFVWDDRARAREWLNTPHPELDNKPPIECAMTELGARRAETVLFRLFHGVAA